MKIRFSIHFLPLLSALVLFMQLMRPLKGRGQSSMTFTVNVIGDEADPDANSISDGHCDADPNTPGDQCTLRAAIQNHNANRNLPQNFINFAIPNPPGSGSIVIKVGSTGLGPLPPVLGSVVITALNNGDLRHIEIDGSMAGNNAIGLQLLGGQSTISFFIINSFSSHGIFISGTPPPGEGGHHIESNFIGTDGTGKVDKGNGGDGVFIENTSGNTIGGLGGRRNLISANKGYGIRILGRDSSVTGQANGGTNNSAQANIIGLDITEENALPNALDAVLLEDAPNNTIGGSSPNQGNTMQGNRNGVTIKGSLSEGIKVLGNFIGKDGTGAKFVAGIFSRGGKLLSVEGNFITNIDSAGIDLFLDANGNYNILKNRFDGNMKIGSKFRFGPGRNVDITYQNNFHVSNGTAFDAQESLSGVINWIVLGDTMRAGQEGANVIFSAAGNKNFTSNHWEANAKIGFNYAANIAPGVQARLNQSAEIFANNGQEGVSGKINVGGELGIAMADLVSSSNGKDGARLDFVMGGGASVSMSSLRNKYTVNAFAGFRLVSGGNNLDLFQGFIEKDLVDGNLTGGVNILNMKLKHSVTGDTITNNGGPGIELGGNSDVHIEGNTISGNTVGIFVNDAAVGSINDNTITENGKGIALAGTAVGTAISGNAIFANTGIGIDLGNDGVTANHTGGPIPGPNQFQNYPVLTSAGAKDGNTIINGTLNGAADAVFRLEFFSNGACNTLGFGEGKTFLGFKEVTTDGTGNIVFSDTVTGVSVPATASITATATDSSFNTSEFSACLLASTLPLHLLSFTGTAGGGQVTLYWRTASERNVKEFIIQRSGDGNFFNQVGQVPVSGFSSQVNDYMFTDRQPLQGKNFYRLKMVDRDEAFTYSGIIALTTEVRPDAFFVFPVPSSGELNIRFFAWGQVTIQMADAGGRILKEQVLSSSGSTTGMLDISDLPGGTYILVLQDPRRETRYQRFVKQ